MAHPERLSETRAFVRHRVRVGRTPTRARAISRLPSFFILRHSARMSDYRFFDRLRPDAAAERRAIIAGLFMPKTQGVPKFMGHGRCVAPTENVDDLSNSEGGTQADRRVAPMRYSDSRGPATFTVAYILQVHLYLQIYWNCLYSLYDISISIWVIQFTKLSMSRC